MLEKRPGIPATLSCTEQYLLPETIFCIHTLLENAAHQGLDVERNAFVRIQHLRTGLWLQADSAFVQEACDTTPFSELDVNNFAKAIFVSVCGDNCAIRLVDVPAETRWRLQLIRGVTEVIASVIDQLRKREFHTARYDRAMNAMSLLIFAVTEGTDPNPWDRRGQPVPEMQMLLREQKVIDLLMDLAAAPFHGDNALGIGDIHLSEYNNLRQTIRMAYVVLQHSVRSNTKNALHLSRYFPFMLEQIGQDLYVGTAVMEMFSANRLLLRHINEQHIDMFIDLIRLQGKYARYVNFLRSLCVQNELTIPRNQDLICERLIRQRPELLVLLKV